LNRAAITTLQQLGLDHVLKDGIALNRVIIGYKRRSVGFSLPHAVAISRETLDIRLSQEAVISGAEFRPGVIASLGAAHTTEREVIAGGTSVSTRVAVLATGLAGGEAIAEVGSRIGGGVMVSASATPPFYAPGAIYMATGQGGYVGVLHVEAGKVDVAAAFDPIYVKSAGGLGPAAVEILNEAGWPSPTGLASLPWKGTPALTRRSLNVAGERFFLVGDAAGYVEPFTGEGMAWGVMSAAALGPLASRATDWSMKYVEEWELSYRRIVDSRRFVCRTISKLLRSPRLTGITLRLMQTLPILPSFIIRGINTPAPKTGIYS
jgi:flavin-dependent dehydrogenase